MHRAAQALNDAKYRSYGEQNLEFIFRHVDYFMRQHDAQMKAAPVGDGKLPPIGFYFEINALSHTGLVPFVPERHAATKDVKYEPFPGRMSRFLAENPCFDDGSFYREDNSLPSTEVARKLMRIKLRRGLMSGDR